MKPLFVAASFGVLSLVFWPTPSALAQDAKVARGTVTAVSPASLTLEVRSQEMTFAVDGTTTIEAPGAAHKARAAIAAGKPGPMLTDVVKAGQPVAITYQDMNGARHASLVRAVATAGANGGSIADGPKSLVSSGRVQAIGDRFITIRGDSGGGASFSQTFAIDERTKVLAKGAGTAAAAKGGRLPISDVVASGDFVTISYEKGDSALHASNVRVTMKH